MMQPDFSCVKVSCCIPLVRKVSVSRTVFCSCTSSALKYMGKTSFPSSSNSFKASTNSCSLAPITQEAVPGVEGGDEIGGAEERGVEVVASKGVVAGGGVSLLAAPAVHKGEDFAEDDVGVGGASISTGKCIRRC